MIDQVDPTTGQSWNPRVSVSTPPGWRNGGGGCEGGPLQVLRPTSGRKPGRSQGKGKLKAASIPPATAGHVLIRGKNPPLINTPRPTTRPRNQTTTPGSNTPGSQTTRPAHTRRPHSTVTEPHNSPYRPPNHRP